MHWSIVLFKFYQPVPSYTEADALTAVTTEKIKTAQSILAYTELTAAQDKPINTVETYALSITRQPFSADRQTVCPYPRHR